MTYLNLNQLSQKLGGRSRSSLYRDVEAGRIPEPIRLGGRPYWIESQVDDALTKQLQDAA
nr:AlpA family phage regulatory protein [Roseovarius sp. MMSF_3350]